MTALNKKVNKFSTPINFQTTQMAMTLDEIMTMKRKTKKYITVTLYDRQWKWTILLNILFEIYSLIQTPC